MEENKTKYLSRYKKNIRYKIGKAAYSWVLAVITMTRILLILLLLSSCILYGQGDITWKSDTIVNDNGDTTILPEVILHTIEASERFDSLGNLKWQAKLISNDTVKETVLYPSGSIESEYFIKLYHPIKSILDYNQIGGGYCIRKMKYCENGTLTIDHRSNSSSYKVFNCDGIILFEADSCNKDLLPTGLFTVYDSLTSQIKETGIYQPCSRNRFVCCEEGWWESYENGKLTSKKFYKNGKLIEEKDYR